MSRITAASSGDEVIFWCGRPLPLSALCSASRPRCSRSSRCSRANHWRILLRARVVVTMPSQSRDGPRSAFDVSTSTMSPLESVECSGTMRPLTLAPTQRWPTSVCTEYAKSSGVAPAGSALSSPFGVKT